MMPTLYFFMENPAWMASFRARDVKGKVEYMPSHTRSFLRMLPSPPIEVDVPFPRQPARVVALGKIEQRDVSVAIHHVPAPLAAIVVPDALGLGSGIHTTVAGIA